MTRLLSIAVLTALYSQNAVAQNSTTIDTASVSYEGAAGKLGALLLTPRGAAKRPAVVVIQGSGRSDRTNSWSRGIANELAAEGLGFAGGHGGGRDLGWLDLEGRRDMALATLLEQVDAGQRAALADGIAQAVAGGPALDVELRVAGAGHSFTPCVLTDGTLLSLELRAEGRAPTSVEVTFISSDVRRIAFDALSSYPSASAPGMTTLCWRSTICPP